MTVKDILQCVVLCDACTCMANAFRKAFGLPQIWELPRGPLVVSDERYADLEWCMTNHGSPLDGRI